MKTRKRHRNFVAAISMTVFGVCTVANGQTVSTLSEALLHWRCEAGDVQLNHNPALKLSGSAMLFDSLPYAKDYTMIAVYKPGAGVETDLWRLTFGDSAMRGLTTEQILSDNISIRYSDRTDGSPAINTLRQSAPDITMPYAGLSIGGDDTLEVAEVLYYSGRIGNAALRRIQSALAVRYGITLGPVDYLDGAGRVVWSYADNDMYHHRVTGIGRDTLVGLHQLCSRSEMGGAVLTLMADSLGCGTWLIAGDNNAPLTFESEGNVELLDRIWRVQSTQAEGHLFSLMFDTRGFAMPGDSLVLLVDGYVYLPDSIGGDSIVFEGVEFPADSGYFKLGRGGLFWDLARTGMRGYHINNALGSEGYTTQDSFTAQISPNPSNGHYVIEARGAEQIQVTIYNIHGSVMATFSEAERGHYRFEGELPAGNVYFATIVTESGSQTMKLVVE